MSNNLPLQNAIASGVIGICAAGVLVYVVATGKLTQGLAIGAFLGVIGGHIAAILLLLRRGSKRVRIAIAAVVGGLMAPVLFLISLPTGFGYFAGSAMGFSFCFSALGIVLRQAGIDIENLVRTASDR